MKKSIRFLTLASALLFALSFSVISCSNASGGSSKEKKTEKTDPETPEDNGEEGEGTQTIPAKTMLETPLTFEAVENGTMKLNSPWLGKLKYKINDEEEHLVVADDLWQKTYDYVYIDNVKAGDIITFTVKEDDSGNDPAEPDKCFNIWFTSKYYVYGNVMSLLYVDFKDKKEIKQPIALARLFQYGNAQILNHPTKELVLPATKLSEECYQLMFSKCGGLTKAPELPATELAKGCYDSMFSECTGLTEAPELPATELAQGCYYLMFNGCTGLTAAPELPATELVADCYEFMFSNCSALKYIHCPAQVDSNYSDCTSAWLSGVSSTGKFVKPATEADWRRGPAGIPDGWLLYDEDELNDDGSVKDMKTIPLTIRAVNNCTLSFARPWTDKMKYSINGGDYQTYTTNTGTISLKYDDRIRFGTATDGTGNPNNTICMNITGSDDFYVYGNVMSLVAQDFENAVEFSDDDDYAFRKLFMDNEHLKDHPENALVLPATKLSQACYSSMFQNCIQLTKTPVLPATTLAKDCYASMFASCSSLETACDLPALKCEEFCYSRMFENCSSLKKAPVIKATTVAHACCLNMFSGCEKLEEADYKLPAETLANNCYEGMFRECAKLTKVPELPATNLAESCYSNMFCFCTSLEKAPVLPAKDLVTGCYSSMFERCSSLKYIKCLAELAAKNADIDGFTHFWVYNVADTGVFVHSDSMDWTFPEASDLSSLNCTTPPGWTKKSVSQELAEQQQ